MPDRMQMRKAKIKANTSSSIGSGHCPCRMGTVAHTDQAPRQTYLIVNPTTKRTTQRNTKPQRSFQEEEEEAIS